VKLQQTKKPSGYLGSGCLRKIFGPESGNDLNMEKATKLRNSMNAIPSRKVGALSAGREIPTIGRIRRVTAEKNTAL
jgi:hypothetical protein